MDRLIGRHPQGMPTLPLHGSLLLAGGGTLARPSIHPRGGDRGDRGREDLGRAHGRGPEQRALGDQEGFNSLAEIPDEVKAIDDLALQAQTPENLR
jgi:hypothetical protein